MKEKIEAIVLACCAAENDTSERKIDLALGLDAPLYGSRGVLDSIGLVSLLVAVEQGIEDSLDLMVTLADSRAFSQENSPFRSVRSLCAYAVTCVEQELASHG